MLTEEQFDAANDYFKKVVELTREVLRRMSRDELEVFALALVLVPPVQDK